MRDPGTACCLPRAVLLTLLALLPLLPPGAASAASPPPAPGPAVAQLEQSLLSMLSLTRRPQLQRSKVGSSSSVVPSVLLELYERQGTLQFDTTALHTPGRHTRTANTVRAFTHQESVVDHSFPQQHTRFRLAFNVRGIPEGEVLQAADVQLTRLISGAPARWRRHVRVLVHDVVRPGRRGVRDPILRLLDSKVVDVSQPGKEQQGASVMLDVLPAVQRWHSSPSDNHGLLIEVVPSGSEQQQQQPQQHIRLRRAPGEEPSNAVWLKQQPLLLAYTEDTRHRRRGAVKAKVKRGAPPPRKLKRKDGRENCQRHALYVNFEEVGWNDWIVAPPGYDAYYCHGDCPFPLAEHLNTTNHAVVQTLMHSMSPSMVPKACCVPTELSSISMLYLDEEGKVVLKNYKDMAVQGCGCR